MFQFLKCQVCHKEDNYNVEKVATYYFICHKCTSKNYPFRLVISNKSSPEDGGESQRSVALAHPTLVKAETLKNDIKALQEKHQKITKRIQSLQTNLLSQTDPPTELILELTDLRSWHSVVSKEKEQLRDDFEKFQKLEEKIMFIQNSVNFLSPKKLDEKKKNLNRLKKEVEKEENKIQVASSLAEQINKIENDFSYMSDIEAANVKDILESAESTIEKIQTLGGETNQEIDAILKVQDDVRRELECCICLNIPGPPNKAFSCIEHHLICWFCVARPISCCPICRQDFNKTPATQNRLAEKMIAHLC